MSFAVRTWYWDVELTGVQSLAMNNLDSIGEALAEAYSARRNQRAYKVEILGRWPSRYCWERKPGKRWRRRD